MSTQLNTLTTLEAKAIVERGINSRPSLVYEPGRKLDLEGLPIPLQSNGQYQIHAARHVFRIAAPGNGWGKTTLAAVEVDWWGWGDHPYQRDVIPRRPRVMLWVCQKFQQYEVMRAAIERWWPTSVRLSWNGQHHSYSWPDGSRLYVFTAESSWQTLQGVEPDLVVVDEESDSALWHELTRRRRGKVETRYLVTATATQGLTWTYRELYLPWLQYHADLGLDEHRAVLTQQHVIAGTQTPGIFCWPAGSHRDNPTATKASWAYYLTLPAGSKAEREVRLYGGYRDFSGQPVFDLDSLERMRVHLRPGRMGRFEEVRKP